MKAPGFKLAFLHPRYWLLWFGLAVWWLICQLPYPLLRLLAVGIGQLLWWFGGSRKRIARRNIELCFPQLSLTEQQQLLRRHIDNIAMALFETGISWWWPQWRFRRLVKISGEENIAAIGDSGALMLAIHQTTLEVGAAAISKVTPAIDGMYRPHKNALYDYVQAQGRLKQASDRSADVYERNDVRGVLKALRNGRRIWYAPDQDYGPKQSIFLPFMGVEAAVITATHRFAKLGKAAVVPFVTERLPRFQGYAVTIKPAVANFPTNDEAADTARINEVVEEGVRLCPAQYLWVHRRFKTRPAGEPSLY